MDKMTLVIPVELRVSDHGLDDTWKLGAVKNKRTGYLLCIAV
jgi:hypothetical protein